MWSGLRLMRGMEGGAEPRLWRRYEEPSSLSVYWKILLSGDLESLDCAEGAWQAQRMPE